MPNRDGTGPTGGPGRGSRGRNRNANTGPEGFCTCPKCGEKVPHQRGSSCGAESCPKCGAKMTRD